ncbi:nucleoside recognition domain-containing protein [Pleionea sediminis]|uniref:nucleoside recognition domain-containing protein n=1 Tax=Pleionea sediminis TaxID=2569479 RepID=UPI001FE599C5|nr:spore maturation protein [Pleionea sediminis]
MNKLWGGFFLVAFVGAMWQWLGMGNLDVFSKMMTAIFDMAKLSIEIALGLVGLLCFWMGMLKLAESSGLLDGLSRLFLPLFHRLMPDLPRHHPAFGHITMNMAANLFGLDNAATPAGIKAMESMQEVNPKKDEASNAQILFLVINTSSVTLFPVTILMYRAQLGAAQPADVFVPILLATSASTLVGLGVVALVQKINIFNRVVMSYAAIALACLAGIIGLFHSLSPEEMTQLSSAIGNGVLLLAVTSFVGLAMVKRVPVYDEFIAGAKHGFELAVKIMPYLVAMLVAIGLLRASGVLELVLHGVGSIFGLMGADLRFIDALPTGIMNPFSGSGARALMLETMNTHGVDSFAGRLAAVFQGSTETTFYVLAVYFGAVNIRRLRHAIGCGLAADLAGIVAAIVVSYWFFS